MLDEDVVGRAEVVDAGVLLERQHHVAAVDLGAGVQLAEHVGVPLERRKRGKRLGDLVLGVAMLRQGALHTRDDAAGLAAPEFLAAHGYPHGTHLS